LQEVIQSIRKSLLSFKLLLDLDISEGGQCKFHKTLCRWTGEGHPARMFFAINFQESSNNDCRNVPEHDFFA
jgi:hypothetical protein